MNVSKFISGKTPLNQYIHRLVQDGASFQVHYWGVMPKHYDNLLHKHSFFEVCFVVEGEGEYIDGDCTYPLHTNTMFLSMPDVLHQVKSESGLFLLYVGFELIESESSEEWIRIMEEARQCSRVVIAVTDDATAALLWKSLLIQAIKTEQAFFEDMLTNIASSLILSLLRLFVPHLRSKQQKASLDTTSLLLAM